MLLGGTLLEAAERIDETNFDLIKTATLDRVKQDVRREESREALRKGILGEVEAFKDKRVQWRHRRSALRNDPHRWQNRDETHSISGLSGSEDFRDETRNLHQLRQLH